MNWQAGKGFGRTFAETPAEAWQAAHDAGDLTPRPDVASMTVGDLAAYATDDSRPFAYRVAAQDELSRRAHYEEDREALAALLGEVWTA